MAHNEPDRATLLALSALMYTTEVSRTGAAPPTLLMLRAVLALTHARGSGDHAPYQAFWHEMVRPVMDRAGDDYCRATYARTALWGIMRTLGLEPGARDLSGAVDRLVQQQREAVDPNEKAKAMVRQAVSDAKYDREIISTKGNPHSERGKQLMAERIARGEAPDGKPW